MCCGQRCAVALVLAALLAFARSRGWAVRALALAMMVLALANPSFTREDREPLSSVVAVVVDKSPSQNFGDRLKQTETARAQLAERLGRIPGLDVRFVEAGEADGETDGTRLFAALSAALADVPPDRVAGAILLTDGRVHDVPAEVAALGFNAPVHALITGARNERDRRVVLVTTPRFGIVGQSQTIVYRVEDQGARASPAEVTIRRDGEVLDRRTVTPGNTVNAQIPIPHAGPNIVEIEASPLEGELTAVNNRAVVSIDGVRDKLRVLLVSGEPHAGERTWRNLLKSDASVDLVHFTILRPPEKQDGTPINELSLIAFPTRELFQQKIKDFHLIIFDRYARQGVLPIIYFDNIARYVQEGGAVLVAAGPDYASPTSIWRTPLEQILPAEPSGRTIEIAVPRAAHRPRQAPSGDARAGRLRFQPAALEPLVPPGRHARRQRHHHHGRPRQEAAAGAVARGRRPRRPAAVRSHLAVGARLRGRRPAPRPDAPAVALADEAARSRGRGAAPDRARPRSPDRAPDHGRQRQRGDADLAVGRARAPSRSQAGEPGLWRGSIRATELGPLARHRRQAQRAGQCRPAQSARIRRGDLDHPGAGAVRRRDRRRRAAADRCVGRRGIAAHRRDAVERHLPRRRLARA